MDDQQNVVSISDDDKPPGQRAYEAHLKNQKVRDIANWEYHRRNGGRTGHIPVGADVFD